MLKTIGWSSGAFDANESLHFKALASLWLPDGAPFKQGWAYVVDFWKNYIDEPLPVHVGGVSISIFTLALGLLILFAAWLVSKWLRLFLQKRLEKRTHIDPGIQYTLLRLTHYFIITVGVLSAFTVAFQTDLTKLTVVLGALSLGIGFGLQYIAGDIASGFILLFERPVRVGDFITVNDVKTETQGKVQSINLRTTTVLTNDRIAVIVPNSKLVNQTLVNWSYGDRRARIPVPIGVSYDSDVDVVTQTLLRAAEGITNVLQDPKPSVQFLSFGDWSLNFRLLVWTDKPRLHPQIKSLINYRISKLFREAGIEIPFPQSEFRLRGGAPLQIENTNDAMPDEGATNGEERDNEREPRR
ncbi:MAG: mechanosensitive ion channel family protein [Pyrinomonadaceae bacterium]